MWFCGAPLSSNSTSSRATCYMLHYYYYTSLGKGRCLELIMNDHNMIFYYWSVTAEKMFQHMRDKRLFLFNKKKGRARMLPLTVYGDSTNMVVFSVKSATNQLHFVCQICDRGFPTFNGLSQHVTHPIHSKQETALISKIRKVCGFVGTVISHVGSSSISYLKA